MEKISIRESSSLLPGISKCGNSLVFTFLNHSRHDGEIKSALRVVANIPLLWLAIEILESRFEDNRINENVAFRSDNKKIEFIDNRGRILARLSIKEVD